MSDEVNITVDSAEAETVKPTILGVVFNSPTPGMPPEAIEVGRPFNGYRVGRIEVRRDFSSCRKPITKVFFYSEDDLLIAEVHEAPRIIYYAKKDIPQTAKSPLIAIPNRGENFVN